VNLTQDTSVQLHAMVALTQEKDYPGTTE